MPDPAAMPRCVCPEAAAPKRPVGVITSTWSPAARCSFAQTENAPPSTRFTAMRNSPSSGPAQIE